MVALQVMWMVLADGAASMWVMLSSIHPQICWQSGGLGKAQNQPVETLLGVNPTARSWGVSAGRCGYFGQYCIPQCNDYNFAGEEGCSCNGDDGQCEIAIADFKDAAGTRDACKCAGLLVGGDISQEGAA
eukprot:547489-Karenia_brevis.AAC.1